MREHRDTLCKGGCGLQRAAQPLQGLSQENPKPCLKPPRATKRQVFPRSRGASGEPRHRPVKLREGQTHGTQNAEPPPPPSQVPAGLCTAADAPTVGPKTRHPRQPCQSPFSKGQRSGERNSRRGVPGSAHSPSSEHGTEGVQSPQRHDSAAPQLQGRAPLTDAEPLRRRLAGSRLPRDHGDPRARGPSVRWDPPTSLGGGGRRQLRASPGGGRSLAAAGARPRAARELGSLGPAGQGGPPVSSPTAGGSRQRPSRTPLPLGLPLPLPPPPSWERVAAECCHPP